MFASLAMGAATGALGSLGGAGGGGGAAAPGPMSSSELSDRSPINIAPIGVNLGAIMLPYNEGSFENGGFGLEIPSRYKTSGMTTRELATGGFPTWAIVALGGGALLLLVVMRK